MPARTLGRSDKPRLLPPAAASFLNRRMVEGAGLAVIALGLALSLCLISYHVGDPSWDTAGNADGRVHNLMGLPGAYLADLLLQSLGAAAYLLGLVILAWGWRLFRHRGVSRIALRLVLALGGVLLAAVALARAPVGPGWLLPGTPLGGSAGVILQSVLAAPARALAGAAGTTVATVLAAALGATALGASLGFSLAEWRSALASLGWLCGMAGRGAREAGSAAGAFVGRGRDEAARAARDARGMLRREPRFADDGATAGRGAAAWQAALDAPESDGEDDAEGSPRFDGVVIVERDDDDRRDRAAPMVGAPPKPLEPGKRAVAARQPTLELTPSLEYELPSHDLLQPAPPTAHAASFNEEALRRNAEILEGVLGDFGVLGDIVKVHPGPVVTLYELEPAPGTKTARVIGLADDIARSMSAVSVRVAVVPGRNVIGIELPNAKREMVFLRELLAAESYERSAGKLALILGKDIGGAPVIADLARMPHLLVAGTTGSGKSVAINTMILSLLYRLPPDRCRFIMIDPKMLELSVYEGIPHLLSPVVTEPKKAVVALKWTVREMENRYRAMSKLGVRNIEGYNARLREARRTGEVLTRRVQTGFDPDTGKPVFEEQPIELIELPYIVVIVDEMADLMLVAGKDIEAAIQRLAQMARAAGIHLIMATQRPSVDVITGTIKANFPTRISFQVTSKIDSRTILGEQGAEQLLGQGDMLYMAGGGRITRVHGPFVHDDEVEQVVSFLKAQGEPDYIDAITDEDEPAAFGDDDAAARGGSGDDLYDQAVALVCRERKASTSFVQRHLQIGYNRAARLIEQMEAAGVVSAANHVGKREVLARNIDDIER